MPGKVAEHGEIEMNFDDWCECVEKGTNGRDLTLLTADDDHLLDACSQIAALVPTHYAAEEHIARILERLGKAETAQFIREKLPQSKAIRSGDLGEILATEYIAAHMSYTVPIKRLRWKDHRNMAMRGDDVIGIVLDPDNDRVFFLKSEAKSRVALSAAVVEQARAALDLDQGLPSPHALGFVSQRLVETGDMVLADAIDTAQLKEGITEDDVEHLMFTVSGNDPEALLETGLAEYEGSIPQYGVGLRINRHASFVHDVYEKVIANGDNG